MLRPNILGFLF